MILVNLNEQQLNYIISVHYQQNQFWPQQVMKRKLLRILEKYVLI
jgi:hypothetical protein